MKFNTRLKMGFLLLLLKVLYMVAINVMLPYEYMLWTYNKDVDFYKIVYELIPFFICEFFVLYRYKENDSFSFFSILLFTIFFIPANSGLSLSNNDVEYYILINLYSAVLFFVLMCFKPCREDAVEANTFIQLVENKRYMTVIRIFMVLVCAISLVRTYMYNGLNLTFVFSDMYSVRADYASYYASTTGSITAYVLLIVTNLGSWFMPIYLYYAIVNKKLFDVLLSIFSIIAVFTIEMMKAQLLVIPIVLYFAFLKIMDNLNGVIEKVTKSLIFMIIASLVEFGIRGESWLFRVVIRRLLYVPTYMINVHYSYFHQHNKILFTNDAFFIQYIGRLFFGRKYPYTAVKVISENCFSGLIPSPNTGMFAEAYAQLGVVGIFVFPFIILWIANLVRKYSQSYGSGAVYVALTYLAIRLISVYILTSSTFIGIIEFVLISMIFRFLQKNKAIKEKALAYMEATQCQN